MASVTITLCGRVFHLFQYLQYLNGSTGAGDVLTFHVSIFIPRRYRSISVNAIGTPTERPSNTSMCIYISAMTSAVFMQLGPAESAVLWWRVLY